jgi:aryl-alcohol dehydrogenase-like predicted oxidoreductase
MPLPADSYLQLKPDLRICRLLNGLWQVSGAHGTIDPARALPDMQAYQQAGFDTWDLADHYGPAEDFVGQFRRHVVTGENFVAFTKWVPRPGRMTRAIVEEAVNVSLRRMQTERLDSLQFHWWDYGNRQYMDALYHLNDLRQAGKIRYLALTNFDTEHVAEIIAAGIPILTHQVQYSLIDRRPEAHMSALCLQHGIGLLTYGTLCGGLLSERYWRQPEPTPQMLKTASLRKYKQMIDLWGGWVLFQELLNVVKQIAEKHNVTIANVATRYILDKPAVAGVIVGVRLGIAEHRAENASVFNLKLDAEDVEALDTASGRGRDLLARIGDCGDEYRG